MYKVLPKLLKEGLVRETRSIGSSQLYALNPENDKVRALIKLEEFLLNKSFSKVLDRIELSA